MRVKEQEMRRKRCTPGISFFSFFYIIAEPEDIRRKVPRVWAGGMGLVAWWRAAAGRKRVNVALGTAIVPSAEMNDARGHAAQENVRVEDLGGGSVNVVTVLLEGSFLNLRPGRISSRLRCGGT